MPTKLYVEGSHTPIERIEPGMRLHFYDDHSMAISIPGVGFLHLFIGDGDDRPSCFNRLEVMQAYELATGLGLREIENGPGSKTKEYEFYDEFASPEMD